MGVAEAEAGEVVVANVVLGITDPDGEVVGVVVEGAVVVAPLTGP